MILNLLQLASPALPLGAYSYSEGIETLIKKEEITDENSLESWLIQEINQGSIRIEAAIMLRAYRCFMANELMGLTDWNQWLSAARETSELRKQSWQMGNSLIKLLLELEGIQKPSSTQSDIFKLETCAAIIGKPCNYSIAFGLGASYWQIEPENALLGYLHSWATNLINAGVKLIPMGQTHGQKLLLRLHPEITQASEEIYLLEDDDLVSCSWGLGLASMQHETQYTRLFRS
ncbi:MAG: urease accessory protein UreF [Limnoraphis robusta]